MGTLVFQATAGGSFNFVGPNIAGTVSLTLPSADGTSGQFLKTDGAGTLSFAAASTAPGGSTTQVQYNNAGAFAGSANLTFDGTTLTAAGLSGPHNGTVGATTPAAVVATTVKASTTMGVGAATPAASGSGITFPATQSASTDANTLDDYEEGTWTAVARGGSTAGTYEIASQISNYTKIGRAVCLEANITMAASITGGGAGDLWITGLPFTKMANSGAGGVSSFEGVDYGGVSQVVVFQSSGSSAVLNFLGSNDNAGSSTTAITGLSANDVMRLSITYFV
jgi:hypothetical protein